MMGRASTANEQPVAESMWWPTISEWTGRIVRQRAHVERDWCLRRAERWWYTLKAIVCVVLNRDEYRGYGPADRFPNQIEVAHGGFMRTYHPEFGQGGEWNYLAVGCGIWSGWWFKVGSAGYP